MADDNLAKIGEPLRQALIAKLSVGRDGQGFAILLFAALSKDNKQGNLIFDTPKLPV